MVVKPPQAIAEGLVEALGAEPPISMHAALAGYRAARQSIGCSGAAVFRLDAGRRPSLFLKIEEAGAFAELPEEAARLRWLASQDIPCPAVMHLNLYQGRWWLLLSAIGGGDLASSPHLSPQFIVETAAAALRALHNRDVRLCPFDGGLDRMIGEARKRVQAGAVCRDEFGEEWEGYTPEALFDELLARRPGSEDLVVAHGDPSLPNMLSDGRMFTGFVDCGRLGISDRHRDLAVASRSIARNVGSDYVAGFFERYGVQPCEDRLIFYRLLDEFF